MIKGAVNMGYKIVMTYNQTDFIKFMKACQNQIRPVRVLRMVSISGFRLAGVLLILIGGINIACFIGGLIDGDRALHISVAFVIIGQLLLMSSDYRRLGKLMWEKYDGKGSEIAYYFYDRCFIEYKETSEHKFDYSVIKGIYEDKLRYYLFVDESVAHIINKSGFQIGDSKQFAIFIAKQAGMDVKQIK
ncbi:MAG TPA: hypothetical protein DEF04_10415 [Clostridiales bacterium]|nr:hypothetical protein [Clostridiales bacterium]